MIFDLLKDARKDWREIVKLARPVDAKLPVHLGKKPKSSSDFEAYTDNRAIYINVDEKKFKDLFDKIVVPAYGIGASKLYDVSGNISKSELLKNLVYDTFLFVHFHEQLHPWLCPNGKYDEQTISKTLYEGVQKAEPKLAKSDILFKVNNSKNLIWDLVLNVSFLSKTAGYNSDNLEEKINIVFKRNSREISLKPITHYPSGILPTIYMTSAATHKTDIPISLIGLLYSSMSFNDAQVRENAVNVFLDDLKSKKMQNSEAMKLLTDMYSGLVSEIKDKDMSELGLSRSDYLKRVPDVTNFKSKQYEENQKYFVSTITKIFDTHDLRYNALKGFIQVLSPYISTSQKQGSPDPNAKGQNGSGGGGGAGGAGGSGGGEDEDDGDDSKGSGSGKNGKDPDDDIDDDLDGKGGGAGKEPTLDEMEEDSIAQTLDDLLGTLGDKDADDLLQDGANGGGGYGGGAGGPGPNVRKKIAVMSADEYYKKNATPIEVRNPSEERTSFDIGNKQVWRLKRAQTITSEKAASLNQTQIRAFQKKTGLPMLIETGKGFYKLLEYEIKEIPLKSYTMQATGVEVPENWIHIQDSSSSMAYPGYVGSGCRFDILNMVKYGLLKGLHDTCKKLKKDVNFGVVDFSSQTDYRGTDSLVKIYESRTHPIKEISLSPQCGGTSFDVKVFNKIKKDLKPGNSVITFVTDGDIYGDLGSLYKEVEKFAKQPGNAFVFVEISNSSTFGHDMENLSKTMPNVLYYSVSNIASIKDKLSSVLIKYN